MSPHSRAMLAFARDDFVRALDWAQRGSIGDVRNDYAIRYAVLSGCEALAAMDLDDRARSGLPLDALRGLRNRLAHGCWDVDDHLLRRLVTDLAPDLITRIDASAARP